MNLLVAKIDKKDLTKDILSSLRNNFNFQSKPNDKMDNYKGYHLCIDKKNCELLQAGKEIEDGTLMYISPEVYGLVLDYNFQIEK